MIIENVARSLAQGNEEKYLEYVYIMKSKLVTLTTIGITILIAYILGIVKPALIIGFTAAFLRGYSGGVHSKSVLTCSVVSIIVANSLGLVVKYLVYPMSISYIVSFSIMVVLAGYYIIFKNAPIDSCNRPIISPDFRKRMKKLSLMVFTVLILTSHYLLFTSYKAVGLAIMIGITWQLFTMTKLGTWVFQKVDKLN